MPKRSIFAIPWSMAHRAAFKDLAAQLQGPDSGNPTQLARMLLEEFMLCEMSTEEIKKRSLLPEWRKDIPEPSLMAHALEKFAAKQQRTGTSVPKVVGKK